jgi:hypothetical protein
MGQKKKAGSKEMGQKLKQKMVYCYHRLFSPFREKARAQTNIRDGQDKKIDVSVHNNQKMRPEKRKW